MSTPKAYDTTPLSTVEVTGCPANRPRGPWSRSRNRRRSNPRDDTTNHIGPVPPFLLLDDVEQGQELVEAMEPGRDPDFVADSVPGSGGMYATTGARMRGRDAAGVESDSDGSEILATRPWRRRTSGYVSAAKPSGKQAVWLFSNEDYCDTRGCREARATWPAVASGCSTSMRRDWEGSDGGRVRRIGNIPSRIIVSERAALLDEQADSDDHEEHRRSSRRRHYSRRSNSRQSR